MEQDSIVNILKKIAYEFLDELSNSTLYYLNPGLFQKLGREKFIREMIESNSLDKLYKMLVTNPDIYDSDIDEIQQSFKDAMKKLRKNKAFITYNDASYEELEQQERQKQEEEEYEKLWFEKEREKEKAMKKTQKRVEKMVKEYQEEKEDYGKEYEKESKQESKKWVDEYDKTILDYFVNTRLKNAIRNYISKLVPEQKKFIVDMLMQSKNVLNMSTEERMKFVAQFIQSMAKQSSKY